MSEVKEDYLIEVFFKETNHAEADTDIVFSVAEAEEVVLDFYNEKIRQQLPEHDLLDSYEALLSFKKQSSQLIDGEAWFRAPSEADALVVDIDSLIIPPEPEEEPTPATPESCNFLINDMRFQASDFVTDLNYHLFRALHSQLADVDQDRLHQLISDSLWKVLAQVPVEQGAELEETPSNYEDVTILLIRIAEDDIAVYLNDEFIDSSSLDSDEDVKAIIDSANILADRFKTQVIHHQFKEMMENWTWRHIETILQAVKVMPTQRKHLLHEIQNSSLIRVGKMVANTYQIHEDVIERYAETGDGSENVITIQFGTQDQQREIHLAMEEIIKATEIAEHTWVCNDLGATELTVLPSRYMTLNTGHLLR